MVLSSIWKKLIRQLVEFEKFVQTESTSSTDMTIQNATFMSEHDFSEFVTVWERLSKSQV